MLSIPGFQDIESFIGLITSILFSISPIFTIVSLIKKIRNHNDVSFFLYFCMFLNSLIFFVSSLCKLLNHDNTSSILNVHPMDYSNLIGSCLCYIWCIIVLYYRYNNDNKRLFTVLYITLFTALTIVIVVVEYIMVRHNEELSTTVFDVIGSVINVLMYVSPGLNVVYLFKQKKPELIRIETAFFGSINSLVWLIWAIRSSIGHSIIANGIGFPLCVVQIIYFVVCYRSVERNVNVDNTNVAPILYEDDVIKVNNGNNNNSNDKKVESETEAEKLNNEIDNYM